MKNFFDLKKKKFLGPQHSVMVKGATKAEVPGAHEKCCVHISSIYSALCLSLAGCLTSGVSSPWPTGQINLLNVCANTYCLWLLVHHKSS